MLDALTEWRVYQHLTPCSTLCWAGRVGGKRDGALLGSIIVVINVDDRDGLVRKEAVGSLVEHMDGEVAHNRFGLHMQVLHHIVAIPAAHHVYVVHVDSPMKECHCSTGPQGPITDFQRFYARAMIFESHSMTQDIRHIFGFGECLSIPLVVCRQRRIGPGLVTAMMEESLNCCLEGAAPGVAAEALSYFLIAVSIFLSCERILN
jgi:hypothetical protein